MKWRSCLIYCLLTSILFAGCTQKHKQKKCLPKALYEVTIDSLLNLEMYDAARSKALKKLPDVTADDYKALSFLYARISKSYDYSFHFDSAVYYSKEAYDASLRLNDKDLQGVRAAGLLAIYDQSTIYSEEQEKMFAIISNQKKNVLAIHTQIVILDALVEYYDRRHQYEMGLYLPRELLKLYKKYAEEHTLRHQDSLSIALAHMRLGNAYIYKYYEYAIEVDSFIRSAEVAEGIRNLNTARSWLANDSRVLAQYYSSSIYASFTRQKKDMALYRDSLVDLAQSTGANFNSLIVRANINIADYYFYFDDRISKKTKNGWKYYRDALKYNNNLIEPDVGCMLQCLAADLLIREHKYNRALKALNSISGQYKKLLLLRQQLGYTHSLAQCYESLGKFDSAVFYYEKNIQLSDTLHTINGGKIFAEAENKYQIRLNQEKIAAQNIIIKYNQRQQLWLTIGIVIAVSFILLLIVLYRKLNKQNETLNDLNQQLEIANNTKAKLFAIISHDFRSPVNQVYQLLKLQQSKSILFDPAEKALLEKQTQTAAIHLLNSMEELLTWSKTQMQSFNVTEEKVDIYQMCCDCIGLLQTQIQAKELQLDVEISESDYLYTDPNFLLTILRNLLQNAIKASPEKETIIIRLGEDDMHYPFIRIVNKGAAFTQLDYLFALTETSNLLKGGLGLIIVDELSRKINVTVSFKMEGSFTCCDIAFKSIQHLNHKAK